MIILKAFDDFEFDSDFKKMKDTEVRTLRTHI
jgi:hypothetical protein